jgi:predicted nucleic acid-binding protein
MRVVDTSAWIEWLLGTALGKRLEPELPSNDEWIVPTIVQYELMRASIRALSKAQADAALAFSKKLAVRQLDTDLAVEAADYAAQHSLAMADAVIYATAMNAGADLLTCDAHFANLPGVVYFAKSSPP